MESGRLSAVPDSSRLMQRYDAHVGGVNPGIARWTLSIFLLTGVNYFGERTPSCFLLYCQNCQEIHHGSFFDTFLNAFLVPLTLTLWPTCVGTLFLNPFCCGSLAQGCRTLIDTLAKNLSLNLGAPFALRACDPSPFFALFHAFLSSEMSLQADYPRCSLNVGFPCSKVADFPWTFSWVGDSHR